MGELVDDVVFNTIAAHGTPRTGRRRDRATTRRLRPYLRLLPRYQPPTDAPPGDVDLPQAGSLLSVRGGDRGPGSRHSQRVTPAGPSAPPGASTARLDSRLSASTTIWSCCRIRFLASSRQRRKSCQDQVCEPFVTPI